MVAFFDADQRDKVQNLSGKFVGVSCLPANEKVAPEVELWTALESYSDEICHRLGIANSENLLLAISSYESDDHHDRLYSVSSDLSISFETLVSSIVHVWCERNPIPILKFILSLKFSRVAVSLEDISSYIGSISTVTLSDVFGIELEDSDCSYKLLYDGVNLSLASVE